MFWRFGGYANISTIDTLLEKPDVTLEELLEESDLIQELKSHNTKLIEYLREDAILQRLLEYVVAPKLETIASDEYDIDEDNNDDKGKGLDEERSHSLTRMSSEDEEDDKEKKRNRYAFVAAEILASDSWSLSAALLENEALLRKFWEFLASPPPLDPLQAGYFTKVNEALLDKKTEEMLELFKSIPDVVKNMLQHVDSPMVMDLLLKIISLEKAEGGQGIVDWLHTQDLMPTLLSFLSSEHSWATQTSAGDFLKAIITISANASQNEQSCIGPNELTRQLVSQPCVEKLISDMLKGGNPLTVGVGIVIEVIRKNNSDYDPEVGTESQMAPSSRDPIYLGTLLRMFAKHVPDFMALILSPDHTIGSNDGPVTIKRKELNAAFGGKVEPLGFDRFKTCELMAELLHCSNMGLLNERGSEELVRARDAERERLRAEGKLAPPGDRFNLESDDLTMRSSNTSRLGSHSPDEGRRLGVQNASDDDGFEEVTHAQDLGDDAKDDFDEKLDAEDELLDNIKTENFPSFLDKDDDEFVDEPLSSPRLNTEVEALQPATVDSSLTVLPLSPTKDLSDKVKDLDVSEEAKDADAKPPSYDDHSKDATVSPDEQAKEALDEAISNQVEQEAAAKAEESVKAEEAVKTDEAVEATFEVPVRLESTEDVLTPHPDDRPAPLFSKKKTETPEVEAPAVEAPVAEAPAVEAPAVEAPAVKAPVAEGEPQSAVQEIASQVPIPEDAPVAADFSGTEIEDSTMVDVDGTIRLDNIDDTNPIEIEDDFSSPVVGDYLKMQFVEHRVVPTILDFFFRFPWNNFLHNVVYDVVQQVFNGPMDRGYNRNLAVDLFETGDITNRIVGGQNMSDEAQQLERMRLGYMGHLTLIAEEVVKFTERHPPELLSELVLDKVLNLDWNHYVEVTLAETRERDNAILGGVRPDQNLGPRQAVMNAVNAAIGGGSSALADAGLNGNSTLDGMDLSNGSGTSGSGFGLGGGSLLSGFGSSSDEEDEEMDEDMNDDDGVRGGANVGGAEFSRYISNPSTTTATSETTAPSDLDPPAFAPPPPPPLNIPPSRARRQLAARLALHQKAQETSNGDDTADKDPDAIEAVANPNPFADTDSDDELTIEAVSGSAVETSAWDMDAAEEGKLVVEEGFEDNFGDGVDAVRALQVSGDSGSKAVGSTEEVGNGEPATGAAAAEGETDSASRSSNFSGMWPFNHASRGHRRRSVGERYGRREEGNDFFGGSDSDSDEGFDGIGEREASGDFDSRGKKPSGTTEARRRTSLDDEEVVEVGRGEGGDVGAVGGGKEGEDKVA